MESNEIMKYCHCGCLFEEDNPKLVLCPNCRKDELKEY